MKLCAEWFGVGCPGDQRIISDEEFAPLTSRARVFPRIRTMPSE